MEIKNWKKYLNNPAIVYAIASLGLMLFFGFDAYARGGGGENYTGHSSGGGGGGGDGGDGLIGMLFALVFSRLPWPFKLALIIIIIVVIARRSKRKKMGAAAGNSPIDSVIDAVTGGGGAAKPFISVSTAAAAANVSQQVADLKARDPAFSEQQFEDLASTAFFKIQEAWSKRDMNIAKAFISPTLFGRFESQLSGFRSEGKINKMDKLAVGSVELVEAVHDGGFDYITVKINASAADYIIDQKTQKMISGSQEPQPFTEYWTFLRSDSVKTKSGGEQIQSQHCPNCGAPLQVNAVGKCEYCGSELTSGAFSWVLSEISQASVWKPRAMSSPRPQNVTPLAGERYVLGLVKCPSCGANVQDVAGITNERCWRCGATVPTKE